MEPRQVLVAQRRRQPAPTTVVTRRLGAIARNARHQAAAFEARLRNLSKGPPDQRLLEAARLAQAAALTAEASLQAGELDEVLAAAVEPGPFLGLESLRAVAIHPPFRSVYSNPAPALVQKSHEAPPVHLAERPTGPQRDHLGVHDRGGRIGSSEDDRAFMRSLYAWWRAQIYVDRINGVRREVHATMESKRLQLLARDQLRYDRECRQRAFEADLHNARLDTLVRRFAAGDPWAVEEYFGVVLSSSIYPGDFIVRHRVGFDADEGTLKVDLRIPGPDQLSRIESFRYDYERAEIVPVLRGTAEHRARYTKLLHDVSMRTLNEIWGADHTRTLRAVELRICDPAPASQQRQAGAPLLAVAVTRREYEALPHPWAAARASLHQLGATVSTHHVRPEAEAT